jgi:hypothetical protein
MGKGPRAKGTELRDNCHRPMVEGQGPMSKGQGLMAKGQGPRSKGHGARAEGQWPRVNGQGPMAKGKRPRAKGQGPGDKGQGPISNVSSDRWPMGKASVRLLEMYLLYLLKYKRVLTASCVTGLNQHPHQEFLPRPRCKLSPLELWSLLPGNPRRPHQGPTHRISSKQQPL